MIKKVIFLVIALLIFVTAIIKCNDIEKRQLISTDGQSFEKAEVTEILKDNLAEDGYRYGNQEVMVRIKSGEYKGRELAAMNPNGSLFGANCKVGTQVIVMLSIAEDNSVVTVYSKDRSLAVYIYILIFAGVICLIGGIQGVKAVGSLLFTFVCIFFILFPLMYRGVSPILAAILISVLSTVATLGLLGGVSGKTLAAIAGTTAGVVIAGAAALLFGRAADISGYNVADIETLAYVGENSPIQIGQLLFSGIIIASLGAVMDVGMSIASTIQELHDTNPAMTRKKLFLSGMHVGRDMMGTMANTLILAFVGGSITGLVTNYAYDLSYNQLINSYAIGIELMQGLSGSLGVVMTVPVTAAFGAFFVYKSPKR